MSRVGAPLGWNPPPGYRAAIEVLSTAELRRRGSATFFARSHRLGFFLLLGVGRGTTRPRIDFTTHTATARCWILAVPGQLLRFDLAAAWHGQLVAFRPESLPPEDAPRRSAAHALASELGELAGRITLDEAAHAACWRTVRQMARDAQGSGAQATRAGVATGALDALLLHQLYSVLYRLRAARTGAHTSAAEPAARARVAAFRRLLELHAGAGHDVAWYARALGCNARTLTRSTLAVAGDPAKTLLSRRVALEAKRLLVHTELPVWEIAERLGFAEASNFTKFFRRETGRTPSAFRERPD